jgi:predicted dehydrogenase/threonine dehydrogenase-like Zn-dependent dehydrogenase
MIEVPEPAVRSGAVSVCLEASVLSAGTERATLDVASKGLIAKARARPDQAGQVFEKVRRDGVRSTISLVRRRLEELGPLGYSAAGKVIEVGAEVRGLVPGNRVAIAGGGIANHAEIDVVPSLLCAPVPAGVSPEQAAFATLGAIALNGFRRADVQLGSTIAVVGLGLVGQLAVRIARAAGCRVLGVDLRSELVELANRAGAEAMLRTEVDDGSRWESSADAVLICAATGSSDPIQMAARLARDRAAVVVVGDVPMDVPRAPFYEKELDLRLSRSYGPGRYDPNYELHGLDYPIGHVRWTEQRNMTAFLSLIAQGKLDPSELVTHRYSLADAEKAFDRLMSEEISVGIVLRYDLEPPARPAHHTVKARTRSGSRSQPRLGLIGAGSFATAVAAPGLTKAGFKPWVVASASGLSAESARRAIGFEKALSDGDAVISREDVDLVAIVTQHNSHARLAAAALRAGKPVYVEKPLALTWEELAEVRDAHDASKAPLFVGFNRRYAPLATQLRALPGPRLMNYRVNAGRLPRNHWINDLERGGGRLKGEGCHFVDFVCDQAESDPVKVTARGFPSDLDLPRGAVDNFSLQIAFADGSVATIGYAADAPTGPGKERFETSGPGAYGLIEDFKTGAIWMRGNRRKLGGARQDKGFAAQYSWIANVVTGRADPPDPWSFFLSTLTTLAAARSIETGAAEGVVLQHETLEVTPAEPEVTGAT